MMSRYVYVSELLGKTLNNVEQIGDVAIIFTTVDGGVYRMYHEQDCCEYVHIEDITGELSDLVGAPLLMAEEVTNKGHGGCDSETWTYYKFATVKGYVTIRWYGTSNGYYSESVDFVKEAPAAHE